MNVWLEPPGYTAPPLPSTQFSPKHPPSPLPARPGQCTSSGYRGYAHFSIMSSSACRKRKPLRQPYTPSSPLGILGFLVPSIFSMKFLCLPLSWTTKARGGEGELGEEPGKERQKYCRDLRWMGKGKQSRFETWTERVRERKRFAHQFTFYSSMMLKRRTAQNLILHKKVFSFFYFLFVRYINIVIDA